jgi:magnesium-transporting ATPase (P-type)
MERTFMIIGKSKASFLDALSLLMTICLKSCFFGAIVSIVIGMYNSYKQENKHYIYGAVEGVAILVTFIIVTYIDALNSNSCERKIQWRKNKTEEKNSKIMVYRDSSDASEIQSKKLVVGDIFQFTEGMMIPADSIII